MKHDCPTCLRRFDSKRAMSIHHTKTHGFKLNKFKERDEYVQTASVKEPEFIDKLSQTIELRIIKGRELCNEFD